MCKLHYYLPNIPKDLDIGPFYYTEPKDCQKILIGLV